MKIQVKFNLLPADYKQPAGSDVFMKMAKSGSPIKFIIVGSITTGFSYWTNDKQCIRSREKPTETPDIKVENGKPDRVSHFWILPVWDCTTESVKLLEITQRGLQDQLIEIFTGADYDLGDLNSPMAIKISATGEKLTTKYTLMPVPVNVTDLATKLVEGGLEDLNVDEIIFAPTVTKSESISPVPVAVPNPTMTTTQATDMM